MHKVLAVNKSQAVTLTRQLTSALRGRAVVSAVPRRRAASSDRARDAVQITTRDVDIPSLLVPVPAGEGYPQDVRAALHQLPLEQDEIPVLAARRMSPGARALLDEKGLCWADEAGNIRLDIGPLVVVIDSPGAPRAPSHGDTVRWSDASGAIAELVLDRATRAPHDLLDTVSNIAAQVGVSPPIVSRTLRRFDATGWTERSGPNRGPQVARRLIDPGSVLSSWATWHTTRQQPAIFAHALVADLEPWLGDLRDAWPPGSWALTGEAAAQLRAPYLSSVARIEIYLDPETYDTALDELLDRAALEPVPDGGRIQVRRADPYLLGLVTTDDAGDLPLVPDVRLYGDLLTAGVRGEEAATAVRDRRIGF